MDAKQINKKGRCRWASYHSKPRGNVEEGHSLNIQGVPYHNDNPWTGDKPVYDSQQPKIFF